LPLDSQGFFITTNQHNKKTKHNKNNELYKTQRYLCTEIYIQEHWGQFGYRELLYGKPVF
ncbi:hypothetical protein, partial [Escherichia coli]